MIDRLRRAGPGADVGPRTSAARVRPGDLGAGRRSSRPPAPCVHRQRLPDRLDRPVDVVVGVRRRDHERLPEDASLQHLLQEQGPELLRGLPEVVTCHEHQARRPADDTEVVGDPQRGGGCVRPVGELAALLLHDGHDVALPVGLGDRQVGRETGGLGTVGRGEEEGPGGTVVRRPPSSISSRLPARADTAKPLPSALPHVDRSGVTP